MTCKPGFRLKDGACVACPAGCYQCNTDETKCADCNHGFYLKDYACTACDPTCAKCSEIECKDCKPTHGYAADLKKCEPCAVHKCGKCDVKDVCL